MIGGATLLPEILGQTDRVGAKSQIFLYFACSASAVTPSEKVILSPSSSLPLLAKTNAPMQRGLSAIAEHLVILHSLAIHGSVCN